MRENSKVQKFAPYSNEVLSNVLWDNNRFDAVELQQVIWRIFWLKIARQKFRVYKVRHAKDLTFIQKVCAKNIWNQNTWTNVRKILSVTYLMYSWIICRDMTVLLYQKDGGKKPWFDLVFFSHKKQEKSWKYYGRYHSLHFSRLG